MCFVDGDAWVQLCEDGDTALIQARALCSGDRVLDASGCAQVVRTVVSEGGYYVRHVPVFMGTRLYRTTPLLWNDRVCLVRETPHSLTEQFVKWTRLEFTEPYVAFRVDAACVVALRHPRVTLRLKGCS